jgi:hypothetical protein
MDVIVPAFRVGTQPQALCAAIGMQSVSVWISIETVGTLAWN